jgi:site-specific recombinase XerD
VNGGISAARAALAEEHARRARGEASAADPRLTFQKAHDAWWRTHGQRLKPKTRQTYRSALDQHLLPRWGRSRLSAITAAEVAAFIADQERAGFKGWSVRGQLTALSGVFKFASRHMGYPGTNPVSLLDRLERPKHDERPKRVLTPAELDRLLAAVDEPYPPVRARGRNRCPARGSAGAHLGGPEHRRGHPAI